MTSPFPTLAIIGAGNMGACLLSGLIAEGHAPHTLWASSTNHEKLHALQKDLKVNVTTDNSEAAAAADVLVLAVKPQKMRVLAAELAPIVQNTPKIILSIAAGIRIDTLRTWLQGDVTPPSLAIIRAMPNIPAKIRLGATGLYAPSQVSRAACKVAEGIMGALGQTVWVQEEALLDVVTAVSGAGPAYFFLIMEAMEQAAVQLGLTTEAAHTLILQTALGAAKMASDCRESLATLREQVTSKRGATQQGLNVLNAHDIQHIVYQTLLAAKERAAELAQSAEND